MGAASNGVLWLSPGSLLMDGGLGRIHLDHVQRGLQWC
jgi:hypothetical protein